MAILSHQVKPDTLTRSVTERVSRARRMCCQYILQAGCIATALFATAMAGDDAKKQGVQTEPELSSYSVARRGTATVEDAYRQFLSMAANHGRVNLASEVDAMSFEDVAGQLEALCIIDTAWAYAPNTCLRRDVLAYMTCSYLGHKPGLLTSVFGMTRRYAHREMLYQKIIPPGAPGTLVSGSELLSVVTRVSRRVEPHQDIQLTSDQIH